MRNCSQGRGRGRAASEQWGLGGAAQSSRDFGPDERLKRLGGGSGMRSEKEGEGGPGLPVTTRGPSGKEKPSPTESHFRRESQRREPEAPVAWSSGCGGGAVEPREEKRTVLSKVGAGRCEGRGRRCGIPALRGGAAGASAPRTAAGPRCPRGVWAARAPLTRSFLALEEGKSLQPVGVSRRGWDAGLTSAGQ